MKRRKRQPEKEMFPDPELGGENDPAYKGEMFETFLSMGWKPEILTDPGYRAAYAEWLKKKEQK